MFAAAVDSRRSRCGCQRTPWRAVYGHETHTAEEVGGQATASDQLDTNLPVCAGWLLVVR